MIAAERSPAESSANRKRSIVLLSIVILGFWAGLYVFVPILPLHAGALGASPVEIGIVVAAYGLPQLLSRVPIGLASDRSGRRRPYGIAALLICAIGIAGLGFSPDPTWLAISRFVTGIGASFWVVISVHYAALYPAGSAVFAMGRANALNSFAQFFGNLLGGLIGGLFDLRTVFLTGAGIAVAGAAVYSLTDDAPVAKRESTTVSDRLPKGDLFRYSTIMAIAVGVGFATTFGFLPVLARDIGTPTALIGTLNAARVLALGLTALMVHRVVARIGINPSIAIGLLVLGVTTIGSAFAPEPWSLLVLQVIGGVGFAFISSLTMSGAIARTAPASRGTAMGIYQATYCIGMTGMPFVAGFLVEQYGLPSVFLFSGVVCLLAMGLCWSGSRG